MVRDQLLQAFRTAINWADFNPRSHPQCRAFLFGDNFAFKTDARTGAPLPVRPATAMTLALQPIKTTGKRSRLWADVVARGEQSHFTPSTDKEVLGIVGHQHKLAMQLRDLKFIMTILSGALRDPRQDAVGDTVTNDEGYNEYDEGLVAVTHTDGRVRTHLQQTKETGRASSSRPPLQALANRREGDYARILGTWQLDPQGQQEYRGDYQNIFPVPLYNHPVRSIFCASDGYVFVEADFTGAELAVIAWMCGDETMIEHVRRNILPESHPDHYDIHSRQAVSAFRLTCAPTKKGLQKAGYKSLRVAAKNVNFGIPYGRGAEAIARQCKEENVSITVPETQALIDAYFRRYPGTERFLAECRARSQPPHQYVTTCFGRMRRFIRTTDRAVVKEQERQAQNSPIQGTVADAVSRAIDHLYCYRMECPEHHYRMLLQMHDALLFEVPVVELAAFIRDEKDAQGRVTRSCVLQECMVNRVPVWPRRLDGTPMPVTTPYHFGIDVKVSLNWGESITAEQCQQLGIDPSLV
jgi:hypothetical protein